jgi:hypothetical protein
MSAKLSSLLTQETAKKRQRTPYTPTRHNRFGGTYVLDWVIILVLAPNSLLNNFL